MRIIANIDDLERYVGVAALPVRMKIMTGGGWRNGRREPSAAGS